jgi:hypothetical protein
VTIDFSTHVYLNGTFVGEIIHSGLGKSFDYIQKTPEAKWETWTYWPVADTLDEAHYVAVAALATAAEHGAVGTTPPDPLTYGAPVRRVDSVDVERWKALPYTVDARSGVVDIRRVGVALPPAIHRYSEKGAEFIAAVIEDQLRHRKARESGTTKGMLDRMVGTLRTQRRVSPEDMSMVQFIIISALSYAAVTDDPEVRQVVLGALAATGLDRPCERDVEDVIARRMRGGKYIVDAAHRFLGRRTKVIGANVTMLPPAQLMLASR